LISASSVLVVVIGFSSELPDLLFWLVDLFLFVLFLCFCMDGLEVEGVKDLSSRRDKEGAF
jgi:hypothetical protein